MRKFEAAAITACGGVICGSVSAIAGLLIAGAEAGITNQGHALLLVAAEAGGASLVLGLWLLSEGRR